MRTVSLSIGLGMVGVWIAATLLAGDLNPPAGPVTPTMKTNQEIFDAIGSGGGGGGACTLGIPGEARGAGVCTFASLPGIGGSLTFGILTFDHKATFTVPAGGGGGGGSATLADITITRVTDSTSHRLYRACTTGTHMTTATITLSDGAADYFKYDLTDVVVSSIRPTVVYRCDGTFIHAEVITLQSARVRYTELATGHFWEWNTQTATGTGG